MAGSSGDEYEVGILGCGEVGRAIASLYRKPRLKDLDRRESFCGIEVLNVCIPYSDIFLDVVRDEIAQVDPKITIIHSTVAVGTTAKICSELPGHLVVHSPVRGPHPHLADALRVFTKFVGADDEDAGRLAEEHLRSLGLRVQRYTPAAITELGKLLDTAYYGLCIAWHGEMKKMCRHAGVHFDDAVTFFNTTYNEGYRQMGWDHVVRPVLRPPRAHIGGHCVVPNARILQEFVPSLALKLILRYADEQREPDEREGD